MAATPSNQNKLGHLRHQLAEAKQKSAELTMLTEQLEQIEEQYAQQEEQVQQLRSGRRGQEGDPIEQKVAAAEQALSALMAQKQQIDDQLDGIGEEIEQEVEGLERELVHAILEQHPEDRAAYEALAHELNEASQGIHYLNQVREQIHLLQEHLEAAVTLRHRRRRGFFEMLFTRNPRSLLALHLLNTRDLCLEFRQEVVELQDTLRQQDEEGGALGLLAELESLLTDIIGCCPDIYSHGQFDRTIPLLKRQLSELTIRLDEQLDVYQELLGDAEDKLQGWIEDRAR